MNFVGSLSFPVVNVCLLVVLGCTAPGEGETPPEVDSDSIPMDTGVLEFDTDPQPIGPAVPLTCLEAEKGSSSAGCSFMAVDLENSLRYLSPPFVPEPAFAVALTNVHPTKSATAAVQARGAGGWSHWGEIQVSPLETEVVTFDGFDARLSAEMVSGILSEGVFEITSDSPLMAYQFNPMEGDNSWGFTSDATMLIPTTSWGSGYDVVGMYHRTLKCGRGPAPAYIAVIALDDDTSVEISPEFSPESAGDNIPPGQAPFELMMDAGQTLYLHTDAEGEGLSGTRIQALDDGKVAVFSAHDCTSVPNSYCHCSHVEQQLVPREALGLSFVAARAPVREHTASRAEKVFWQVVSSYPNTTISFKVPAGVEGHALDGLDWRFDDVRLARAGEMLEFFTDGPIDAPGDFWMSANRPVTVMQYVVNTDHTQSVLEGDPAMVYLSPTQQFLHKYVLYVPQSWETNFLVISRRTGSNLLLNDDILLGAAFKPVADSGFEVARVPVDAGTYVLESENSEDRFGVFVVGYSEGDGYAYNGGMGLWPLVSDTN